MHRKGYKGRFTKRISKKSEAVCKLFDALMEKELELLEADRDVAEIWCNVPLDGLEYTTDFLFKRKSDSELMAVECVYRQYLTKPMTGKQLDISRMYWLRRGIEWGLVIDAEK